MAKIIGFILICILGLALLGEDKKEPQQAPQPKGWKCVDTPGGKQCVPIYGDWSQLPRLNARFYGEALPAVDLPEALRQKNWLGTGGGGSCVHATAISLLRWAADGSGNQALYDLAENWPWDGGEFSSRFRERVEQTGLKYVMTVDGDEELLTWAILTRRGCAIAHDGHCRALVGFDPSTGESIILDNNHTSGYIYKPWRDMVSDWQRGGGWAYAFVCDPPTPVPNNFGLMRNANPLAVAFAR